MKLSFFIYFSIFLFSCGKNSKVDPSIYLDDDGDQIVNRDELSNKDRVMANLIPLERIEGEIEFYEGISRLKKQKIPFTNHINLHDYSLNLLLKNKEILNLENHFSEFTSLKATQQERVNLINQKEFNVQFKFKLMKSAPKKIFLIRNEEILSTHEWKDELSINISKENLELFLEGKASFSLNYLNERLPSFSDSRSSTIRAKTYRIFINHDGKSEVIYVSKKLRLNEIFTLLDIKRPSNIDDINLFHSQDEQVLNQWWFRILSEDDLVFVYNHEANLKKHFLNLFEIKSQTVMRKNGYSQNKLEFIKSPVARMYLEFTGQKTKLSFDTRKKTQRSGGGHDGSYDRCDFLETYIKHEDFAPLTIQDLLDSLVLITDGFDTKHQLILNESTSSWEVEVPRGLKEMTIELKNIDKSTYVKTGITKSDCKPLRTNDTSSEGMLNLLVKSYIEKI